MIIKKNIFCDVGNVKSFDITEVHKEKSPIPNTRKIISEFTPLIHFLQITLF